MKNVKIKTPAYSKKLGNGFFAGNVWVCSYCGDVCHDFIVRGSETTPKQSTGCRKNNGGYHNWIYN